MSELKRCWSCGDVARSSHELTRDERVTCMNFECGNFAFGTEYDTWQKRAIEDILYTENERLRDFINALIVICEMPQFRSSKTLKQMCKFLDNIRADALKALKGDVHE